MKYYSTKNRNHKVGFKEAVFKGIADDGGLYIPVEFPKLDKNYFNSIYSKSFQEISLEIARQFIDDIPIKDLQNIIEKSISFDTPLVQIDENTSILELFHGPTLAFKDFGARFLASVLSYFNRFEDRDITILVATSGDTGSAVANGFYNVPGIKVALLYPSNKVSKIQEQQLTTLDKNINVFEVRGTFDDCQRLVKNAFLDPDLKKISRLTSANSINIARLLPQSFYYFNAYKKLGKQDRSIVFCVPCGNFGNLTAGLIAFKLGLPVYKFIAAVNANKVFIEYMETGAFRPRIAQTTLSNAMDVGDPSNFYRITSILNNGLKSVREHILSCSVSDEETKNCINEVYSQYKYIIDPHGAVGLKALQEIRKNNLKDSHGIVLETAHPAKFLDIVEPILGTTPEIPDRLNSCMNKQKKSTLISSDYIEFKAVLEQLIKV